MRLSDKGYQNLRKILKGSFTFIRNCFVKYSTCFQFDINRRIVSLEEGEYILPVLFPPLRKIRQLEEQLKTLDVEIIPDGHKSSVKQWLQRALSIPAFVNLLDLSSNTIELKVGGDGFCLTRTSGQVNMYFTLFNLGQLIHSPRFVFTLLTANGIEDQELFKNNFMTLMEELKSLTDDGFDVNIE